MNHSVLEFGAVHDGCTVHTRALQRAIDAVHDSGGGRLTFPPGSYVTGSLELKSDVEIHLEHGARILGSTSLDDYPELPPPFKVPLRDNYSWRSLFYSRGAKNIAMTGSGVIDGRGGAPAFQVHDPVFWNKVAHRPHLLYFIGCEGIRLEGNTLRDSAFWIQHLADCRGILMQGLTIENFVNHNSDGIDLDNCSDVVIANCRVSTSDDALCIKSMTPGKNERITVINSIFLSHYNAFKIGTETAGGVRGVTISNCILCGIPHEPHRLEAGGRTRGYAGIAIISADGALVEDITISNCVIRHVLAPIFLRLQNRGVRYWPEAPEVSRPGCLRRISIQNVSAADVTSLASSITGIPEAPVEDVRISNFHLEIPGGGPQWPPDRAVPEKIGDYPDCNMFGEVLPASVLYARHVRNLDLSGWQVSSRSPESYPRFVFEDVTPEPLSSKL